MSVSVYVHTRVIALEELSALCTDGSTSSSCGTSSSLSIVRVRYPQMACWFAGVLVYRCAGVLGWALCNA
jgi:hypothetical protein